MATETRPEPVDFAAVNVGDELEFSTRDNGFGGTGSRIERTGTVTTKTARTVTVKVTGYNPLNPTARLRATDWSDRNVRRAKKVERTPYDADHVHIIDDGSFLTAVWIADPEKAKNPRAVLDAPITHESINDYVIVAEATRYYKTRGATFSGWIVTSRGNYGTVPLPTKKAAMRDLKSAIAEYFNQGR